MIESIHINNYALIDKTEIGLEKGFSVITGETGAGKSILLGAIALTLGQRADVSALMNREKKCVAEIVYQVKGYHLESWFEANELDYSDEVVVRREVTPEGKSRCFINDTPVNNRLLKELGGFLIDIHSQHQSLLIGQPEYQTEILDVFCGNGELRSIYRQHYDKRRKKLIELETLKEKASEAAKEEDYLKFRFSQLEGANLKPGEKEELEAELTVLSNAETIKTNFGHLTYQLRDAENAVIPVLKNCKNTIASLRKVVKEAEDYEVRLQSVLLELKDIADDAEGRAESVGLDPRRIETVNARLSEIYDLMLKYKAEGVEELLAVKAGIVEKLNGIQSSSEEIERVTGEIRETEEQMHTLALQIRESRKKGKERLEEEMGKLLQDLGIRHACFEVLITPVETFLPTGTDEVRFLFAANKNQRPGEIAKVASGGEISRVMLSLKYILSKNKQLPVIVFDEIDTGLSGEVAHRMAQMMQEMAMRMQVISISHLPQIAAAGNCHFKVYKEDRSEHTVSRIRKLTPEERIKEIAGMISGSEISTAALEAAKNLLNFKF